MLNINSSILDFRKSIKIPLIQVLGEAEAQEPEIQATWMRNQTKWIFFCNVKALGKIKDLILRYSPIEERDSKWKFEIGVIQCRIIFSIITY